MTNKTKIILIVVLAIVITIGTVVAVRSCESYNDPSFITLGGEVIPINETDLSLDFYSGGDFSALTKLQDLEVLWISGWAYNEFSSEDINLMLEAISELTNLRELRLTSLDIVDVSSLSSLVNLEYLNLSNNQVVDISPLISLTSLTELNLFGNKVSDISPLTEIANLSWVWLSENPITDLSPLDSLPNDVRVDFE